MWDMRKHILEQKETLDRLLRRRDDAEKQVEGLFSKLALPTDTSPTQSPPTHLTAYCAAAPIQRSCPIYGQIV